MVASVLMIETACRLVESGVFSPRQARALVGLPEHGLGDPFEFPGWLVGPGAGWRTSSKRVTMPELLVALGDAYGIELRSQESEWSYRGRLDEALGRNLVFLRICAWPASLDLGPGDASNPRDFGFPYLVLPMPRTGRVGALPWRA